jgi:hypothetical protein
MPFRWGRFAGRSLGVNFTLVGWVLKRHFRQGFPAGLVAISTCLASLPTQRQRDWLLR